jgi:hypothetical protein
VSFCLFVGKLWHYSKDGFSIRRVQLDFFETRKTDPLDPQLKGVLSQTYSYLARGRQSYAFVSEDGQYVIKLPRSDSYSLPFWLRSCSFSFLNQRRKLDSIAKKKRLHSFMNSFCLAYRELKEETALLYLHLSPTDDLKTHLTLQDRFGFKYHLNLDKTAFVLQRKKPLMIPIFKERLKKGDREGAKALLESFMDLIAARAKKGIFNKDGSFLRNFAYDGERVIQIDVGDFYRPSQLDPCFAFSFQQTMGHVVEWLGRIDPEMQMWLKKRISERVQ